MSEPEILFLVKKKTSANLYFNSQVNSWILASGNTTELTYLRKETESAITSVDNTNPYWISMRNSLNGM